VAGVASLADREWHPPDPSGSTHELSRPEEPGWSGSTDEV
jgi:hypothetical protein